VSVAVALVLSGAIRFWVATCHLVSNLAQLGFDLGCILAAHPNHDFLPGRARFKSGIRKFVHDLGLNELDGLIDVGRIQQIVERLDQAIVEISFRIPTRLFAS